MSLTINNIDITEILKKTYSKLGKGWITLMQAPIERAMEINMEAIAVLQELGYEGIYITLSKDYTELLKLFTDKGVDVEKLAIVDGISQMYGIEEAKAQNVRYVSGPISVDAITAEVTGLAKQIENEKKFVFLDSITTVLLYNSLSRTMQFSRFLSDALKNMGVAQIVVSVSKGFANEELVKELTKTSNEVINLQVE